MVQKLLKVETKLKYLSADTKCTHFCAYKDSSRRVQVKIVHV